MNRPSYRLIAPEGLRKEGDSNPRYGNPHVSLANWWFQPLTHPSSQGSIFRVAKHSFKCGAKVLFIFCPHKFSGRFFHEMVPTWVIYAGQLCLFIGAMGIPEEIEHL